MTRRTPMILLAGIVSCALIAPVGTLVAGHAYGMSTQATSTHHPMKGAMRVMLQRGNCASTGKAIYGTTYGFAEIKLGRHGGAWIRASLRGAMPHTAYRLSVLGAGTGSSACSVLFTGGTTTTNAKGNGSLRVRVPAGTIKSGTAVRVQLVSRSTATANGSGSLADVITSTAT
jgi:hypothetical protein